MRNARGFTLLELMVVLIIVAIMLGIAIPDFRTVLLNRRLNGLIENLYNSLNYARSTALSNDEPVTVCPISTAGSTTCGTNWNTGWIVVKQPPLGTSAVLNTTVLSTNGPTLKSVPIGSSSTQVTQVTFNGLGLLATATDQTLLVACDARGSKYARAITVYSTGFIQASNTPGMAADGTTSLTCP
ncbi:MAG: GspH/FimT family pseudopilin [Metallibacterium sp.]